MNTDTGEIVPTTEVRKRIEAAQDKRQERKRWIPLHKFTAEQMAELQRMSPADRIKAKATRTGPFSLNWAPTEPEPRLHG